MKRFYETATVAAADGGYQIMLDGRQLKSPAKRSLTLPSAALAEAVASEWRAQGEKILPKTMTMMTLAATAVDRVTPQRDHVVDGIAAY
ncbi:MAG: ATP12 family chaperone protein, partial [Pseudomonadota bacterium]|nr:ATP12 family chaperone protein [Pseudomonadota bacterium]